MSVFTYQRVSTTKQSTARQENVLKQKLTEMGITKVTKNYKDKITGKEKDRSQLNSLLVESQEGDIVYCESISRLGRDLKDLIDIIEQFKNKGVRVVILKEGIDTSNSTYKLLLAIFGGVAEMERETIQERTQQRIDQLKEQKQLDGTINTKSGKWFGRQEVTKEFILEKYPKFEKYLQQVENKNINKIEMAKMLGVGRATLYRYIDIYNN